MPNEPHGILHGRLVASGPELLVAIGLILAGLGVALDREWLVGFGVVTLMLGVVLPRVRGALEAGPGGLKVAEIIDASELRERIQEKGKNLPREALERAEDRATLLGQALVEPDGDAEAMRTVYELAMTHLDADHVNGIAEVILAEAARKEWRVTFVGHLSEAARAAFDEADDMILVSGHTVRGVESHSVIVNAATATEAANRVRSVLEGTGNYHRWEATEFPGGGFFGPRREDHAAEADDELD